MYALKIRPAGSVQRIGSRSFSTSYYIPSLTDRPGAVGRGGRSSVANVKVAVFGASGFLGGHFCAYLGANGYTAYLANRGDDMEMRHLKVQFDLGKHKNIFYSPRDIDSIKEVIADADIVVNMIGKHYESGQPVQTEKFPYVGYKTNYSFHDTNVKIPSMLAQICLEMQVDHFVHVSSNSADPDSKSEWSRTKFEGEMAVKEIYPWATIVRPTQLYGRDDRLTKWFADMAQVYRMVPLIDGGKALTQPVWVDDVARAIFYVCDDAKKFEGRRIDCFGPNDYSYKELADFVNDIIDRNKPHPEVPYSIYRKIAEFMQYQRNPLITPDLVDRWSEDNIPVMTQAQYDAQTDNQTKILTLKDLGIQPTPIEKEAFSYLHAYRFGGHFFRTKGYHP